jgi:hypothetical protein
MKPGIPATQTDAHGPLNELNNVVVGYRRTVYKVGEGSLRNALHIDWKEIIKINSKDVIKIFGIIPI